MTEDRDRSQPTPSSSDIPVKKDDSLSPKPIVRIGESRRWADVVLYNGLAWWVEVATNMNADINGQISQVLSQIDQTLEQLGSHRNRLLQVLIYVADLEYVPELNRLWDPWVDPHHPPVRACVQTGLGNQCLVEMVVTAAVD